jgi:6-pyruvoyltetrahydropterin/6-carboxytetrahydropterin synthase
MGHYYARMYELVVERDFRATHAVTMAGRPEPPHEHDWQVAVAVAGPRLDDDGLLCDFHLLGGHLQRILTPLEGRDLNRTPPFDAVNPSAEMVARHVADALEPLLPAGVTLARVAVTEAPGCTAVYRPD